MSDYLDQYIQRLEAIEPFHVPKITDDGEIVEGFRIDGSVAQVLAIREATLHDAVSVVATEIMWYGRLAAQAKRVWQQREREVTIWKARQYVTLASPDGKPDGWKKPSDKFIECQYRTLDEYEKRNREAERAEEAFNASQLIVDAFRAKERMLKADVYRARDGSLQRLSV